MKTEIKRSDLGQKLKESFLLEIKADPFFNSKKNANEKLATGFFLCRQDGQLLGFEVDSFKHLMPKDEYSIGALLAGLWQASEALLSFLPKKASSDAFRLSFDTTDTGLFIYPMCVDNQSFYLGILFSESINPALLKNKGRQLAQKIETKLTLEEKIPAKDTLISSRKTEGRLFDNISDEEMNRIFSSVTL